jgi:hypothetical protein
VSYCKILREIGNKKFETHMSSNNMYKKILEVIQCDQIDSLGAKLRILAAYNLLNQIVFLFFFQIVNDI